LIPIEKEVSPRLDLLTNPANSFEISRTPANVDVVPVVDVVEPLIIPPLLRVREPVVSPVVTVPVLLMFTIPQATSSFTPT